MKNLELKVRHDKLGEVQWRTESLGAVNLGLAHEVDTYFQVPRGRLKLRQKDTEPQDLLIYYHRPDKASSRCSDYHLVHTDNYGPLKELLTAAFGILVVVVKDRHLYMYGDTRIHLDTVQDLGTFVELETLVRDGSEFDAVGEHEHVKQALDLDSRRAIPVSYSNLLLAGSSG